MFIKLIKPLRQKTTLRHLLHLPYHLSNYHQEKVLDIELMCLIVIKKTKTKLKTMSRNLFSCASFKVSNDTQKHCNSIAIIIQS